MVDAGEDGPKKGGYGHTIGTTISHTQMKTKKYKAYSFRLDERTYEEMKRQRKEKQLSWNRYIYQLIIKQNKWKKKTKR